MKYTKKAIEVEALKWDGQNHREMFEFLGGVGSEYMTTENDNFYINHNKVERGLIIKTSEGDMAAHVGDYIVKEPFDKERRYYPVKAKIFELTYSMPYEITVSGNNEQIPATIFVQETALEKLTKAQNNYGYVKGEVNVIALLGLFAESGQLLDEVFLIDNSEDLIKAEDVKALATDQARLINKYKTNIQNKIIEKHYVHLDNPKEFDNELAKYFKNLNALAVNRGLTLNDLAQMCLEKIQTNQKTNN